MDHELAESKYFHEKGNIFYAEKRNILQIGAKLFEEEKRNISMLTCRQTYRK